MARQYTYAVEIVEPDTSPKQLEAQLQHAGVGGWELCAAVVHPETGDMWYHFRLELGEHPGGRPFDRE